MKKKIFVCIALLAGTACSRVTVETTATRMNYQTTKYRVETKVWVKNIWGKKVSCEKTEVATEIPNTNIDYVKALQQRNANAVARKIKENLYK